MCDENLNSKIQYELSENIIPSDFSELFFVNKIIH
jgi:hypothetical protein